MTLSRVMAYASVACLAFAIAVILFSNVVNCIEFGYAPLMPLCH